MKKHKLLYIPEGRYLLLKGCRYYVEDGTFHNLKTNESSNKPEDLINAIITWTKYDAFFGDNNIPYPINENELEIIEVEVT